MRTKWIKPVQALEAIRDILDGTEWSSDTAPLIAEVMRQAGYQIRDPSEVEEG
jgi:hypothetical protein